MSVSILDAGAHARPGAERISGDKLALNIDGTDYWADCSAVTISFNLDGEGPTLAVGPWRMDVVAVQSTDPGSLWSLLWDENRRALEELAYTYSPHGNLEATTEQPHFTGTLLLPMEKPALGGEAGSHNDYTFATRLWLTRQPTRLPYF